ncbi:TPA: glycosyltransferase [Photobacterium damselae]
MKRNILFVINSLSYGGAERALSRLLCELERKAEDEQYHLLLLENSNIVYKIPSQCKITVLGEKKKLFKSIFYIKKYIIENNITTVFSFLHFSSLVVSIVSCLLRKKGQFFSVHCDAVSSKYSKGIKGFLMRLLCRIIYIKFDMLIFKSEAMKLDFDEKYNIFNVKTKVIHNAYDYNEIVSLSKIRPEDSDNWYVEDKYNILSVGRLHKQKRVIDLIHAVEKLPKNINLIIVGDGPERQYLEKYVDESKVNGSIHFLGMRNDVFGIMNICQLYVLCSEVEGFPNTLVEALICGLPVISSDCLSGPREILGDKNPLPNKKLKHFEQLENGIIYPVGDIEALISGIEKKIHDTNKIYFDDEYSIKMVALQYISLWKKK